MPSTPTTYGDLVNRIIELINIIVPGIFALIFVYFVWKVIDAWVIHAGDETKRNEGKQYAVTVVIVFVVMISVWGIVAMLRNSLF
jgi:hypothetical protein